MTNRETVIAYLNLKVAAEDWHGVSDAANDLREMDAREGQPGQAQVSGQISSPKAVLDASVRDFRGFSYSCLYRKDGWHCGVCMKPSLGHNPVLGKICVYCQAVVIAIRD